MYHWSQVKRYTFFGYSFLNVMIFCFSVIYFIVDKTSYRLINNENDFCCSATVFYMQVDHVNLYETECKHKVLSCEGSVIGAP